MANIARGKAESCICMRPHSEYCIFRTSQVNSALIDYCFALGGLAVAVVMPQEDKMEYVKCCTYV